MIIHAGSKVALREPEEGDIPFFYGIRNDVSLQQSLMARPARNTDDDVRSWLEKRLDETDTVFYVIADAHQGSACGFIQLIKIDNENKHGWLGICLAEDHHGKSFADEALSLLEHYGLTSLGLNKILLEVLSNNTRAIRFYLRYGFREVGTLEQHHIIDDHFYDVLLMEKRLITE